MREKIKDLLGRGLSNVIVANAVGCTEAYVSQLLAEPDFSAAVAELKLQHVTKDTERNDKVSKIRDKLLEKLEKSVTFAYKPGEVLTAAKALQTIADIRTGNESAASQHVQSQVVQVMLPQVVAVAFTRNQQNEIIDVGGRSLATMTPAGLTAIMNQRQGVNQHGKVTSNLAHQNAAVEQAATPDRIAAEAA